MLGTYRTRWRYVLLALPFLAPTQSGIGQLSASEPTTRAGVDYSRDVKPVLKKHCYRCHGAEEQNSGLRLDSAKLILEGGDSGPAVVKGAAAESLLMQALSGGGDDVSEMPPEGPRVRPEHVHLIKRWIEQGAKLPTTPEQVADARAHSDHWSLQPIDRPVIPSVDNRASLRNEIDAFVQARLESEGLSSSPEADRTTLIRRLSLDLLGLPPSIDDVESFVADPRPDAYERLVERLLSSSHFGERWGRHWLDAARYADSNGYTIDGPRSIWLYRNWVIDAINHDMPFDRFVKEQLAGDLLPNATIAQKIATGFHRNTMFNQEGGTDAEQFRDERTVDRVNTTGTVFMGLSVGCAQCHSHKFDPISQKEYYQLYAFFNSADEPTLSVPTPDEAKKLGEIRTKIKAIEKEVAAHDKKAAPEQAEWERRKRRSVDQYAPVDPASFTSAGGAMLAEQMDQSIVALGTNPSTDSYTVVANTKLTGISGLRLEVLNDGALPREGPGRADNGNFVLTELKVFAAPLGDPTAFQAIKLADARADHSQKEYDVQRAIDGDVQTGWAINTNSKVKFNVPRTAVFSMQEKIGFEQGTTLKVVLEHQAGNGYNIGRFRLSLTRRSEPLELVPTNVAKLLAVDPEQRTKDQQAELKNAFQQEDATRKKLLKKIAALKKQQPAVATTLVMSRRKEPRESFVHVRGDFLRKGAPVSPDVPDVLPPLQTTADASRLDLAHWLTSPDHPLTARVAVNRIWQRYFGIGLVETENDFGTQGRPPSHPALLDWLASEFISSGWNVKRLHRLIVCSATYRQSSHSRPEVVARDPNNRLLARQRRIRVQAEVIRDAALAASGLLDRQIGGPSVYPYQPDGVMQLAQVKREWKVSKGGNQFRRTMYTYLWRSTPHPFLKEFDAPSAQMTCTRRSRSNTPLQSLMLLNDESFLQVARGLAGRVLREKTGDDDDRLRYAFRLCLSRQPNEQERRRLRELMDQQMQEFAGNTDEARLVAGNRLPGNVDVSQMAAWTSVARVLLNLDETITRE